MVPTKSGSIHIGRLFLSTGKISAGDILQGETSILFLINY